MKTSSQALLARLSLALQGVPDVVEPGYKTRRDWQKDWNCSDSHSKKLLSVGIAKGLIETKAFKVARVGKVTPIIHYRPKAKGR